MQVITKVYILSKMLKWLLFNRIFWTATIPILQSDINLLLTLLLYYWLQFLFCQIGSFISGLFHSQEQALDGKLMGYLCVKVYAMPEAAILEAFADLPDPHAPRRTMPSSSPLTQPCSPQANCRRQQGFSGNWRLVKGVSRRVSCYIRSPKRRLPSYSTTPLVKMRRGRCLKSDRSIDLTPGVSVELAIASPMLYEERKNAIALL